MKRMLSGAVLSQLACAAMLIGCGGGGDEAGSPTAFSTVPSEITVSGPTGTCAAGATASVFVFGGAAPYKLYNVFPTHVALDKTQVDHPGESFTVTFLGGCLNPGSVVIEDKLKNQVTLELINEEGE